VIDEREIVRVAVERLAPPEPAYERLVERRDRKRRNQRIAAGVVGFAVFVAAVWIVTSGLSLDRSEKSVAPAGEVTGPAETGPAAAPASAGTPDAQRPATCSFVQPRASGHLELTYVAGQSQIEVRFVLHQMTLPGHRWRIVLRHANGGPPGPDDWRVFFEGTRLARGDSGDITVQRSVVNRTSVDVVEAKARDIQTGQFCRMQTGLA
jgi:hypothetical protein